MEKYGKIPRLNQSLRELRAYDGQRKRFTTGGVSIIQPKSIDVIDPFGDNIGFLSDALDEGNQGQQLEK